MKPESSYYSAMPWPEGLQFYYVIADPKVSEEHISRKYPKYNTFHVTSDSPNSKNLKVAIAQLCHDMQVWKLNMLQLT